MNHYRNQLFNFSLAVPEGWRQTELIPFFVATGGKVAFSSGNSRCWGTLNVAVVTRGIIQSKAERERAMKWFMKVAALFTLKWRARVRSLDVCLDGEQNTSWVETVTTRSDGAIKGVDGLVETIKDNTSYTIQYFYTSETQKQIDGMVKSFRFSAQAS